MGATSVGEIGLDLVINSSGFQRQVSKMEGLAKKAGATLASAFAVKKLVDFSAKCLDLGSDLAEVENVVDVTFSTMSDQVDKFAKSAAKSFGLSETMAKQYTGTFGAMAKAFGFGEQQAYEMSTALTSLAGDVASFYNLSQDEAYTKLKSVFTGETESLKDLGIVMTQTALDAYAMANGYGKTTSAMTEQEKVALRYKFVLGQLSLAQGDFARTSDSWANQTRLMALQTQSIMASIGQGHACDQAYQCCTWQGGAAGRGFQGLHGADHWQKVERRQRHHRHAHKRTERCHSSGRGRRKWTCGCSQQCRKPCG